MSLDSLQLKGKSGVCPKPVRKIRRRRKYVLRQSTLGASLHDSKGLSVTSSKYDSLHKIKASLQVADAVNHPVQYDLRPTVKHVYHATEKGMVMIRRKRYNQDALCVHESFAGVPNLVLLGVFDGHGKYGHLVSEYVRTHIPEHFDQLIQNDETPGLTEKAAMRQLKQMFTDSIEGTNDSLMSAKSMISTDLSGSTAVLTLVRNNTVICANVGDSRAIVGRLIDNKWQAMPLSVDHKPGDPSEQARVCKAGGVVEQSKDGKGNPIGPLRVWVANSFPPLPGLAMTRSLGDKLGAQAGIIATPELSEYTLQPSDMFLILATDGIWEFCSDDEIVTLAGEYWLRGEMDRAANRLVDHAKAAWDKARVNVVDDITIVLAVLKHPAE